MAFGYHLVKRYSRQKLLISFFSLFLFLLLVHEINNGKSINSIPDILTPSSLSPATIDEAEKEYRKRFNLIDGSTEIDEECTLDYINDRKLAQDHPCVIKLIRHMFMNPPSPRDVSYNLTQLIKDRVLVEHDEEIMHILKNKTGGFFIECGAMDGLSSSKTLDMEMNYNWTGLLIEGSPLNFKSLKSRNRKAWTFPACLSLQPYPTKVSYANPEYKGEKEAPHPGMFRIIEKDDNGNLIRHKWDDRNHLDDVEMVDVQCFPLYSILLASNRTTVDYFSLDIEGHEIRVLNTIPWKKVDIKTLRIETILGQDENNKNASQILKEWIEGEPGYISYKINIPPFMDGIYIKDLFNKI